MTQNTYFWGFYECLLLVDRWARIQHDYGWLASKRIEPLGTLYLDPDFQGITHERAVRWSTKREIERVFVRTFTALLLDCLLRRSEGELNHLLDVGTLMLQHGTDIDEKKGIADPISGVPLLNVKGVARIDTSLLEIMANARHEAWIAAREWSWTQDDPRLHQPQRKAHRHWDASTPLKERIPDQVKCYGDCLMIAIAPAELRADLFERARRVQEVTA